MANPYLISGPALISFSGGRTSAYMLYQILQAHGGRLPDDVVVAFANTGKEREETLRFVHECGVRWGVRIVWLEWRTRPMGKDGRNTPAEDRFEIVGFNSASRNGEPFKALIERKQFLPNAVTRFCTSHLKVDTMKQFMMSLGYEAWTNAIGLRYDEGHRVLKQLERNAKQLERFVTVMPLADKAVKVTSRDIWQFWLGENKDPKNLTHPLPQGFDLGLYPYEGNCDGCFLKGYQILAHQERERPGYLADWIGMEARATELAEKPTGARFVTEYSYADIQAHVARQPLLIPLDWRNLEYDAECGLTCAGEAA